MGVNTECAQQAGYAQGVTPIAPKPNVLCAHAHFSELHVTYVCTGYIQKFCSVMEYPFVKSDLFPAFLKLAKDEQDSVRLLTVDSCADISRKFNTADNVYIFVYAYIHIRSLSHLHG